MKASGRLEPVGAQLGHYSFNRRKESGRTNGFELLTLGRSHEELCNQSGRDHQRGADQITAEHARARAGVDQRAEQPRSGNAAYPGPDRVEERNRKRANLQRKCLAHGEIGRACRGRGEEEDDAPGKRLLRRAERALREQSPASGEQDTRRDIGECNHRAASDHVEQPAKKQRPKEITGRER